MKKTLFIFVLVILLLFQLCACSSAGNHNAPQSTVSGTVASNTPDAANNTASAELKIVSGLQDSAFWGCPTEYGLYGLLGRQDGSLNITYTDYATATEIVLCSQVGCLHNSEQCTGWIPADKGGALIMADDSYLYFIFTGNDYGSDEGTAPEIIRKNLNGQNPISLCTFSSSEGLLRPFISDGTYFYCLKKLYQQEADGVQVYYDLIKINLETGEYETLHQWDGLHNMQLVGTLDDSFVVRDISSTYIASANAHQLAYTFSSVDRNTGEETVFWQWGTEGIQSGRENGRWLGDSYYYYDEQNSAVMKYDGLSQEISTFTTDVPDLSTLGGGASFDCLVDDTLYITNGLDFFAAFSVEDGSATPITLSYPEVNREKPVRIVGVLENEYLVICGIQEVIVHGYDYDGLPIETASDVDRLALISKEDYRNGIPNYTYLERYSG